MVLVDPWVSLLSENSAIFGDCRNATLNKTHFCGLQEPGSGKMVGNTIKIGIKQRKKYKIPKY